MSPLIPLKNLPEAQAEFANGRIWLSVNGEVRQDADLSELIWSVKDIIAFCSQSVRLQAGDLIFTGTPAGVAAVGPGDSLSGGWKVLLKFRFPCLNARLHDPIRN